jgi:hypothetical protein
MIPRENKRTQGTKEAEGLTTHREENISACRGNGCNDVMLPDRA